ncbi:hypothetical protein EWH23_07055 [Meiothermus sp. PNK-Is4]|nr:hypothetical protein DNA98_13295 [Meiothermus sp. Pnk-1]RYM37242.1 hypothetical protein EWH23_07055 [Meiothermus sp. PNK-Is4]
MLLPLSLGIALALLITACYQPSPPKVQTVKWSAQPEWNRAGAQVTIPSGTTAILDQSPPPLRSLTVEGSLIFDPSAREKLVLQADWIMVHGGRLEIGTAEHPFPGQAEIVLTSNNPQDNLEHMGIKMGAKALAVMGGVVEMHGRPLNPSWTRLAVTAVKGATSITLAQPVDWPVGAEIVITSTDHYGWAAGINPANPRSEKAIVRAVNGPSVELERPLSFAHWGAEANEVPEYAEVGLLSRNIVVRSDEKAKDPASAAYQKGGHVMIMAGSQARFDWVEFRNMGQKSTFGRYPVHFHQVSDQGEGSYVKNSSIRESFNRCLVIHGTNQLLVEHNVAFDTLGHCFFLEEGSEVKNTLQGNLAVLVRPLKSSPEERLIPSDSEPAAFWITNPDNPIVGNVAVEADVGFWYALPYRPIPFGRGTQNLTWMDTIYPRRTPLAGFEGNVAHSNMSDGLFVDSGLKSNLCANTASRNTCKDHNAPAQLDDETTSFDPRQHPSLTSSSGNLENDPSKNPRVWAEFKDFVAYKNGRRGVWLRGTYHKLVNPKLADNAIGATFASNLSYLEGGLIVGESANNLTKISGLWTTGLVGFEHYDGHVGASGTVFRNFSGTQRREVYCGSAKTTITTRNAAIGTLRWTSFGLSGQNFIQNVTFDNANPVNYDDPPEPCFDSINNREDPHDGYRSAVFYDPTGSVSGAAGSSVVVKNDFLVNGNCSLNPNWNAYVCGPANLYATLSISNEQASPAALAGTDPSSPLTVTRDAGPQTKLWGTPRDGLSAPNTYFETRLIAKRGDSSANDYTYRVNFGTANRSAKLRVGLNYRRLPDGSFPAGTAGSWVIVGVPVPSGPVWVYRNYYFSEQYNPSTPVASLDALRADASGKAFYREGDVVYLKLSLRQQDLDKAGDYGASVNYHLCSTLECK